MQFVTPKEDAEQRPAAGKASLASTASSASSSSSTSSWLRSKDPRIVRVSRAFGGKDRHSKVCTIRGLRDRRVRLSVPTAIQLYDLQERLGLDQPSKVVDWLLNAAKDEIDELPPLPVSPENFTMFNYHRYHLNLNPTTNVHEKDEEEKDEEEKDRSTTTTTTSHYDFLAPTGSYYPSTGFQMADLVPFPSQILMCPTTVSTTTSTTTSTTQSLFASGPSNTEMTNDIPRQIMINHFQILNADSSSQVNPSLYSLNQTNNVGGDGRSVRFPFEFSMGATGRVLHSSGSSGSRGNEFHSK